MLHALLVDQFALGTRMRHCRWNVAGPQQLQRLFVVHDEILAEILDDMADRARASGNNQTAALTRFLKLARAKAQPGQRPSASQITAELLAGHEAVIRRLREQLQLCSEPRADMLTREFLDEMIGRHEKMARELRVLAEQSDQRRSNPQANRIEPQQATCDSV